MKIIDNFLQEARSFEKKDSVKAIISCPKGRILILRRQNDTPGAGQWDFPGGCIEDGETNSDALKREVFEETGLKIDNIKKIKTVNLKIPESGINSDMNIFSATTEELDVQLKPASWEGADGKPEHNEYCWVSKKSEIENIPMLTQLKKILIDRLKNE